MLLHSCQKGRHQVIGPGEQIRQVADPKTVGTATPPVHHDPLVPDWAVPEAQEFLPQVFEPLQMVRSFLSGM